MPSCPPCLQRRVFESPLGLTDCSWSEMSENQVVTAGTNGSVKLWDATVTDGYPIASFDAHKEDVSTVDWNLTRKDVFASGGWDKCVHVRTAQCAVVSPGLSPR
jgi:peroxin-7